MTYFRFIWKSHKGFFIFCMIILAFFQFMVIRMAGSIDYGKIIDMVMEQLPRGLKAILSEDLMALRTLQGTIALGLNHPMVLVILSIASILVPSRHIAGEIENGTMELMLSFPINRRELLVKLFISSSAILGCIIICAGVSSLISVVIFFELSSEYIVDVFKTCINLFLLFSFVMSITLVMSVYGKEGNRIALRTAGIIVICYLMHYLSQLWTVLTFTKYINPFTFYQPRSLMTGGGSFWLNCTVLIIAIGACFYLSLRQFEKRDIP